MLWRNPPLETACEKKKIPVEDVVRKLLELDSSADGEFNADGMELDALADHIEAKHHEHLRIELPRLQRMSAKVVSVHGSNNPRLKVIDPTLNALIEELLSHMMKEEQILFPAIRKMVHRETGTPISCGAILGPITVMEHEHENAGDALATLKDQTDNYTPPEGACNTYCAFYDRLRELELDMHQHIHKENNILFPKALQLENAQA